MKEVEVDIWKDIHGFNGKYQVGYSGQIRRVYASGKTRIMAQFKRSCKDRKIIRDRLYVHLIDDKGKDYQLLVAQIVARHFLGKPIQGQVPYHVNGCIMDNWASNLAYIDKKELGELTGSSSRRQPVIKINSDGQIVDCYSSAREAGRKNFMSSQTIMDRCNNKCKKAFAPDGFEYAWDEKKVSVNQAIRRIELATMDADQEEINRLKQANCKFAYEF